MNTEHFKRIVIFGGGTVAHIANHFAVTAPAYGQTARRIQNEVVNHILGGGFPDSMFDMQLTRMAGGPRLETNADVAAEVERIKADPRTKIVFFNCALVDFEPREGYLNKGFEGGDDLWQFGKYAQRLVTRAGEDDDETDLTLRLIPSSKIIPNIRKGRKDIFLVGFKTTCGASKQEMYEKGLKLCKDASANLVLVNDTKTRWNMIITPEEAAYHETQDRNEAIHNLVDMTYYRSQLTFTQSTVVDGKPVAWSDERVPSSLRAVVNHCIKGNAYKPFQGKTVGHFAVRLSETEFLTSIRKSDFNKLDTTGLVYVKTDGPDTVLAYGAKPSVGGQSQRIVFREHEGMDCIAHFHCPLRPDAPDKIPTVSQREVECGSHQCGQNTSSNLATFGNLKAVYLDQHGPNIVFPKGINPQEVIDFIERNFDLSKKTGGYNI